MNATAYGISKTGVSIQVAVKMLKGTVHAVEGYQQRCTKVGASFPLTPSPHFYHFYGLLCIRVKKE